MFAVPGWNVSTPLATQVEKAKSKDAPEGKKSQKRKRKQQEKEQEQIDEGNVGEYWNKVIEGKDAKGADDTAKSGDADKDISSKETTGPADKKEKKRKRKGDKAHDGQDDSTQAKSSKKKHKKDHDTDAIITQPPPPAQPLSTAALIPEPPGLTPLQRSMRQKLTSARFRHLNESLYTKPSAESLDLFTTNPEMFEDYHRGFAQQVEVWPENPVDNYVASIASRAVLRNDRRGGRDNAKGGKPQFDSPASKPLPRNFKGHATIADLGCGTASLSHRLQPSLKKLNLTLHSFDLSQPTGPTKDLVTVADISKLPLQDGSVDVAIFCLALMGTNWLDFIDEAWRILRWRGELWVSEIKSRFGRVSNNKSKVPINSIGSLNKKTQPAPSKAAGKKKKGKGGGEQREEEGIQGSDDEAELAERVDGVEGKEGTDVSSFVEVLRKHGFVLDAPPERQNDAIDLSNKMFVKMQFVKAAPPSRGKNVKKDSDAPAGGKFQDRPGRGQQQQNKQGLKMGLKGRKYAVIAEDEDGGAAADETDGKVLKPCLYKIR